MFLRNPFPIAQKYVNLRKYEDKFNLAIDEVVKKYNKLCKSIENFYLKDIFWKLAEGKIKFNPVNWYHFFCVVILNIYKKNILLEEKKVYVDVFTILKEWLEYFGTRTSPYVHNLSKDFLRVLYTESPVADKEFYESLLQEGDSQLKEYNIYKVLDNPNIDSPKKIRKFRESYTNYYEIFLYRCEHIGNEIALYEGNKPYGNNLTRIFNLYGNYRYKKKFIELPENVKNALILIKHIRNAFVHHKILIKNNNEVEIRDRDWHIEVEIPYLKTYFHLLISMDKELNNVAQILYANAWISELISLYNRQVICYKCEQIDTYLILPTTEFIFCRNCKAIHLRKDLKQFL